MDCIKNLLQPHAKEISQAENEQAFLVYQMYRIIEEYLESILNDKWMSPKSSLAICGGIMINCDGDGTDRFLPLKFEIRTLKKKEDVFVEAFGKKPDNPYVTP